MVVRLPRDIEELVAARVGSGEFASAEEVLRTAMAPWLEREIVRKRSLDVVRAKIAEGDADETDFSAAAIREHLDHVASALQRNATDAA